MTNLPVPGALGGKAVMTCARDVGWQSGDDYPTCARGIRWQSGDVPVAGG